MIVHKNRFRTALDQYGFRGIVTGYAAMALFGAASAISYSTHHTDAGEILGRIACIIFLASMVLTYLILQAKPQETIVAEDADEIPVGVGRDGTPINASVYPRPNRGDRKPSPGRHRIPGKTINPTFLVNSFPVGGPED